MYIQFLNYVNYQQLIPYSNNNNNNNGTISFIWQQRVDLTSGERHRWRGVKVCLCDDVMFKVYTIVSVPVLQTTPSCLSPSHPRPTPYRPWPTFTPTQGINKQTWVNQSVPYNVCHLFNLLDHKLILMTNFTIQV